VDDIAPIEIQDAARLRDDNARLLRDNTELRRDLHSLGLLVDKLKLQLAQLNRRQFGSSCEALAQIVLFDASAAPVPAPGEAPAPKTDRVAAHERRRPKRRPLPDHLPRTAPVTIDLPEDQRACPCCGGERHVIGTVVSEKVDAVPAKVQVVPTHRIKRACRSCAGQVAVAPMPAQIIDQGIATPGLLAHVAVAKFCDHLPLARQEKIFARHGVELPRSTLTDWMLALGVAAQPLVDRIGFWMKASCEILNSDDTVVNWHDGARPGKCTTARLWAWRGEVEPNRVLVLFAFTADRSSEHPERFLDDWSGGQYLQTDAYCGYNAALRAGAALPVGCIVHFRRRFFEIAKAAKTRGFAHEIVELVKDLYTVETEARDQNLQPDETRALRLLKAVPVLNQIRERLLEHRPLVPPKGALGKAIGYGVNHWDALCRYVVDGRLRPDNNLLEQQIRSIAVGRNNWLHVASERGGKTTAALYTLIASAKGCGLEPYAYLRDVFTRLPTTKMADIDSLMPHRWVPAS
jgi:transposase